MPTIACFFHKQEGKLYQQLHEHLVSLGMDHWSHEDIQPGAHSRHEIDAHLERDEVLLFLLSPKLKTDQELSHRFQRAHERHIAGEALLIPVLASECLYKAWPEVSRQEVLPRSGAFLNSLIPRERGVALAEVVKELRDLISPKVTPEPAVAPTAQRASSTESARKPRVLPWVPMAVLAVLLLALAATLTQPHIQASQDSRGRYVYQVSRLWFCSDCSARINGRERTPAAPCPQTLLIPPQELMPASLIFYCGEKKYDVDFEASPIRLRRTTE